jgi:pentatricopeptide repeat domain-containing protein 1
MLPRMPLRCGRACAAQAAAPPPRRRPLPAAAPRAPPQTLRAYKSKRNRAEQREEREQPQSPQLMTQEAAQGRGGGGGVSAWHAPRAALRELLSSPDADPAAASALARALRRAGAPMSVRVEALAWAAAPGSRVPPSALVGDQWRFLDEAAERASLTDALAAAALLPRTGACHARLLWALCQRDALQDALSVLSHMRQHGPQPSLANYRVLLLASGKGRTRRPGLAAVLLEQLQQQGLSLDARTANVALNALSAAPAAALRTYEALVASGSALDVVTFNTMLKVAGAPEGGLSRDGRAALTRRLLQDMSRQMCAPNSNTLAAAVGVLGSAGRVDEAFQIWTDMRAGGVTPCPRGWAALLSACRTAEQYDRCMTLFRAMCSVQTPGRHHWNIVIDAAVRADLPERAAELADEMAAAGVSQDSVTRNSLMRGKAAAHGLQAAFDASAESVRDAVAWTILVDLCANVADAPRAADTLAAMRAAGVTPDVVTWTALIKAHAAAGDAAAALDAYRDMRSAGVRPNEATFLMLLRACRAARDVERATAVYQEMRRAGLRPQNGAFRGLLASWVDAAMDEQGGEARAKSAAALPDWLTSAGGCGADECPSDAAECACLDLHGLSSAEARAAVLCKLRQLREADAAGARPPLNGLLLITGRGRNSAHGVAVLRDEVKRLCAELRLACVADATNPGRMLIPAAAVRAWLARDVRGAGLAAVSSPDIARRS